MSKTEGCSLEEGLDAITGDRIHNFNLIREQSMMGTIRVVLLGTACFTASPSVLVAQPPKKSAELPPAVANTVGDNAVYFTWSDATDLLPGSLSQSRKRLTPQDLPGVQAKDSEALAKLPVIEVPFGVSLREKDPSEDTIKQLLRQKSLHHVDAWECQVSALKALSKHPGIRSVSFSNIRQGERGSPNDAELAAALIGFKDLEALSLYAAENLGPETMNVIGQFTTLRHLDLSSCKKLDEAAVKPLARLTNLRTLRLNGNFLLKPGTAKLFIGMKDLEILDTQECSQLAIDEALVEIGKLAKLRAFRSSGVSVTDAGMTGLGNLAALEFLELGALDAITDAGIRSLGKCVKLRSLFLSSASKVTADGLAALGSLKDLERLWIYFLDKGGPAGWKAIASLPRLRDLRVKNAGELTDECARHLAACPKLEQLTLNSCKQLTDAGLTGLSAAKTLTKVEIDFCPKVGDGTARELAKLPNLQVVSLAGCEAVTDAGAKALAGAKKLKEASLGDGTKVTAAGGEALKKALPACQVSW